MELIAKTAGNGKTQEAIEIAKSLSGNTLFISNECQSTLIADRINNSNTPSIGKIIAANMSTPHGVLALILGYASLDIEIHNVVLDVNFGISHADWFKFAIGLEEDGYMVVVTQQLARTNIKTTETLTIRNAK